MSSETLSIVFPIRNQQYQLRSRIENLVAHASRLMEQFEILVVDDHSTDHSPEILRQLQNRFPQLRVFRNEIGRGPHSATDVALRESNGTLILAQESYTPIDLDALDRLWELRVDRSIVTAHAQTRSQRIDRKLVDQLVNWAEAFEEHWRSTHQTPIDSLRLIRRSAVHALHAEQVPAEALAITHTSHRTVIEIGSTSSDSASTDSLLRDPSHTTVAGPNLRRVDTHPPVRANEDAQTQQPPAGQPPQRESISSPSGPEIIAIDHSESTVRPISLRAGIPAFLRK
jgi:hypothetical protein